MESIKYPNLEDVLFRLRKESFLCDCSYPRLAKAKSKTEAYAALVAEEAVSAELALIESQVARSESGRARRRAVTRSCVRVHERAALLGEFQKSSKLPPCGTARQRGRGVFGLCENPKIFRQNSAEFSRNLAKLICENSGKI